MNWKKLFIALLLSTAYLILTYNSLDGIVALDQLREYFYQEEYYMMLKNLIIETIGQQLLFIALFGMLWIIPLEEETEAHKDRDT